MKKKISIHDTNFHFRKIAIFRWTFNAIDFNRNGDCRWLFRDGKWKVNWKFLGLLRQHSDKTSSIRGRGCINLWPRKNNLHTKNVTGGIREGGGGLEMLIKKRDVLFKRCLKKVRKESSLIKIVEEFYRIEGWMLSSSCIVT